MRGILRLNLAAYLVLLAGCGTCTGSALDIAGNSNKTPEEFKRDVAWYQDNCKKNVTAFPPQGKCRSWDDGKQVVTVCE